MARTTTKKSVKVTEESVMENAATVDMDTVENVVIEEKPKRTQPKAESVRKDFAPTDLIDCISITTGYMNYRGRKTGNEYSWENNGDITPIEYQDLRAAMLGRSPYIFNPLFIIDNEELLDLPEWKTVKDLYEDMYSPMDLGAIFNLSINEMEKVIRRLPVGARKSIGNLAKTMMDEGRLDSLQKIKKIDEILGTELSLFISND